MAALLADHCIPRQVVEHLRDLGHTVITARELGLDRAPDGSLLDEATARSLGVLNLNRRDFRHLHATRRGRHAGIVIATEDRDLAALAGRIDSVLAGRDSLEGQLMPVTREQT